MPPPEDKEEELSPMFEVKYYVDKKKQAPPLPQQESTHVSSSNTPMVNDSREFSRRNSSALRECVLKFDNMKFVAGKGRREKIIVQDVSAMVTKGHVLAIMGPSGAGKSTLISSLTLDAFYGNSYGSVLLNGVPLSDKLFKRYCYVVKQQDTNWPYLTTRETLHYAAELYNIVEVDGNEDNDAAHHLVHDIICKMGLQSSADTKVARLSGGQQRRLSLAIALLKQPSILFLDEPTSGLDAASAAAIMREITRVAKEEGIIIVCTIHQPSSKVYNGFDQVMILSKGRLAFVGNASAASGYFQSIGYPLPPATNPAEHFLDLVNADFSSSQEVESMLQKWKQTEIESKAVSMRDTRENSKLDQKLTRNIFYEVQVMFRRHALLMIRDPVLYFGRFVGFLMVNCVFGIVYIAAREYTQDQAVNKLWVSAWYIGVPSNFAVVAVYKLNSELKSIFIENKNGMGSAASYIIAKTMLVTPILFLFAVAALGVPGYLIQAFPAASFGRMILLWTVQIASWESSSEALAALFDDAVVGMMVHTGWWFLALLFSGYLVPLADMFWPLKTFYYVLPYSYYVRSAVYLIFTGEPWEACTDSTTSAVCVDSTDGIAVLEGLGRIFPLVSTKDVYWRDCGALLAICLVWKVVAVAIIVVKAGRVSQIRNEKLGQEFITAPLGNTSYAAGQAQVDEEAVSEVSFSC